MNRMVDAVALCLFFCAPALAQPPKADAARDVPAAQIHTIRTEMMTITELNGQPSDGPRVPLHSVTYDRAGSITEIVNYNEDGSTARRTTYINDDASKRRSGVVTYSGDGTLLRRVEYTFDDSGRRTGQTNYDYEEDGALFRKTVISLDANGGLSEINEYSPAGALLKTYHFPLKPDEMQLPPRPAEQGETSAAAESKPTLVKRGVPEPEDYVIGGGRSYDKAVEQDEHGNWVKAISSVSNTYASGRSVKKTTVLFRAITYY